MKKYLLFLLCISSMGFSYTTDFLPSMDLHWSIRKDDIQEAEKYLDYLIYTEYTPDIDKINYMMYQQSHYYSIGNKEGVARMQQLMDSLCENDPACLLEKNMNWGCSDFVDCPG